MTKTHRLEVTDMAWIAFDGDRPVIICSTDMRVLIDSLLDLAQAPSDDDLDCWRPDEFHRDELKTAATQYRWALFKRDDACRIFGGPGPALPRVASLPELFRTESG